MTVPLATMDIEHLKRSLGVPRLEEALGVSFDAWMRSGSDWHCLESSNGDRYPQELTIIAIEDAWKSQQYDIEELDSGGHLIVLPIKDSTRRCPHVLTGLTNVESLALLTLTIEQTQALSHQEAELIRLREENNAFLRQVSEDFEELTFLRSMAEHLTLEESNHGLNRLTNYTLSLLGQIVGVEHLYFLENRSGHPRVKAEWCEEGEETVRFEPWQLEFLTRDLSHVMGERPLVKNSIHSADLGHNIQGVKELAIVAVSTTIAQLGWLLAINRSGRHTSFNSETGWVLSQHELGTREASLLTTAAAMLASHANNLSLLEERENLLVSVVRTLVSAVDSRDPYTCGHSERVALYARKLAQEIGLDEETCERVYLTGLLHDLGKIGISDSVLKKCGPLTEEEFAEIQRHPDLGWAILQELEQFDYVLPGVLHHHERFDGKGYPDRLLGEETPLEGRLLAVVDSFDAMTSDRPYRAGMPIEKAIEILGDGAGTQWDAKMVDAFLRVLPDIMEIRREYQRPPLPKRKPTARLSSELIHDSAVL